MKRDLIGFACRFVGLLVLVTLAAPSAAQPPVPSGAVITIAGMGGPVGFAGDGGPALSATLHDPHDLAIGPDGTLYFHDAVNFRIRAVDPVTGIITTFAGSGSPGDCFDCDYSGPATEANMSVVNLAVDRARNALYFSDTDNNWVPKVDLSTGLISVYAGEGPDGFGFSGDGGPANGAFFVFPRGVAVDASGRLSIADSFNDRIRQVDPVTGIITTIAGNGGPHVSAGDGGPATAASFAGSAGLVSSDSAGNVFVTDQSASTHIRRIDAVTGIITTVVGGGASPLGAGSATDVNLGNVHAYTAVDDNGTLYFAYGSANANNRVFKVDLGTGQLSLFAGAENGDFSGDGGPALDARFNNIGGLAIAPGGGLLISDTANQRIRYIAPDSIHLVGDAGQTEFYLPWVSALSGDVTVSNNPNVTVISMGSLTTVTGDIDISGNTSATAISMGALATTADIDISGNTSATVISMGALATTADIVISGNTSATAISIGSLTTVTGDVEISVNGNATISMGSLGSVTGDVTIETTGSGTFDMNGADVGGDTSLTLDGYTEVAGATAGGSTAVIMINNEATMEVTLSDGAFTSATPVAFSITNLAGGGTETVDGEMVTHLATYAFDFAIPTLNSAATLNFEIDLAVLDEPDRLLLLDLVDQSAELTLGVRGDAPEAELQLFDVCSSGGAMADACVVVQWLDENRMLLDPLGVIDPAILRLEGLVGHFSTYSFLAVGLAGDYNLDGTVNAADYTVWRNTLGQTGADLAADGNHNGEIDSDDYGVWKSHFGNTSASGAGASASVPEPASVLLVILGVALQFSRRRRLVRDVFFLLAVVALCGLIDPGQTACAQAPVPSGAVITIAGNGTPGFAGDGGLAIDASFDVPLGMAIGPDGTLYFADANNDRIRAIDPTSGIISTIAGSGQLPGGFLDNGPNGDGGPATDALIGDVLYVDLDRQRNVLYIPSNEIFRVRTVDLATGIIDNFAGIGIFDDELGYADGDDGPATQAYLSLLLGLAVGTGNDVLLTDGLNHRLRSIDGATGVISRVAGLEDGDGNAYTATGGDGGPAAQASFLRAWDVTADRAGNIFVMDVQGTSADSYIVRRIDAVTGIIDTIAGGGTMTTGSGAATDMFLATGGSAGTTFMPALPMTVDDAGQTLYLTRGDSEVVAVDLTTGQLTPFAGSSAQGFAGDGGPASDALFDRIGGLTTVPGGGLLVADSFNQRVRYIAPDSIHLIGDAGLTEFHLPWVSAITGNVIISDNPNVTVISTGGLSSVTGVVSVTGNQGTSVIDLSGITSITGNVTITDNGNATVSTGSPSVTGNMTLESTGTGTFSTGSSDVTGNIDLNLDGYTTVATSTGGGETGVTMINHEATMEVTLPDGAFTSPTPVAFSITNLSAGGVETVDGEMVTHLATYAFDFAIPTLNSAATLNFEIDLAVLGEPERLLLLDLVDQSAELTLGVRGDAPEAELQLFDVCSGGGPMADACVVVQWLDENRMLLDPLGAIDPAILRLEGLVGHFSTYSFVAVGLAGDYNLDGTVNAADYTVWRNTLGQIATGLAADGNHNGEIDAGDYAVWKSHYGNTSASGSGASANANVPEPTSAVLLSIAAAGLAVGRARRRRIF